MGPEQDAIQDLLQELVSLVALQAGAAGVDGDGEQPGLQAGGTVK
jgi:hypothetical protein